MLALMESGDKAAGVDPARRAAVADVLGRSAVVVQDLKARRLKDYTFAWDRVLTHEGDTGPFLQYTHARLSSLLDLNGFCDADFTVMRLPFFVMPGMGPRPRRMAGL